MNQRQRIAMVSINPFVEEGSLVYEAALWNVRAGPMNSNSFEMLDSFMASSFSLALLTAMTELNVTSNSDYTNFRNIDDWLMRLHIEPEDLEDQDSPLATCLWRIELLAPVSFRSLKALDACCARAPAYRHSASSWAEAFEPLCRWLAQ